MKFNWKDNPYIIIISNGIILRIVKVPHDCFNTEKHFHRHFSRIKLLKVVNAYVTDYSPRSRTARGEHGRIKIFP